jgi:hypothetical protein
MIIIHNISKEYSTTGWQNYEVKVNDKLICTFDHKASNGLAKCLEEAGEAVWQKAVSNAREKREYEAHRRKKA